MPPRAAHVVASQPKPKRSSKKWLKIVVYAILPLIFASLVKNYKNKFLLALSKYLNPNTPSPNPTYLLLDDLETLTTVDRVLSHLHIDKMEFDVKRMKNNSMPMNWDLLWTYYHFERYKMDWSKLNKYQKINHWPGNFVLAAKSVLSTQVRSKYIPKAFLNASDLQDYAENNPGKRYIMKYKGNRGLRLVRVKDMKFNKDDDYFVQEFVENPLLWDDFKFDFSLFVVITSVNPLRVYYYDKSINLRFTEKQYSTNDPSDAGAYVIDDLHIPGQHFGGVKDCIQNGYNSRDAFEHFIEGKGGNVEEIWRKVENLIRSVTLSIENVLVKGLERTKTTKYNHFELFRFDMMFNETFDVFLLEVNMSPNLNATIDKIHNKPFFENILYNLFNLVGVGTSYQKKNFKFPSKDVGLMVANPDGISIKPEICLSEVCLKCKEEQCSICYHCFNDEQKYDLIEAYKEQMNIGDFKRIFPPDQKFLANDTEFFWASLTDEKRKMCTLFTEICKKNRLFC